MTDAPSQQPPYYNTYQLLNWNECSKDETYQDLGRSEGEHELDLLNSLPTQQPSQQHQPLEGDQCSNDEIYEDLTKLELAGSGAEQELDLMTNVHAQQRNINCSQESIQGDYDEINRGMIKEAELDNVKAAIKKMKIVLVAAVIVNIVLLVLLTLTVILGNVQSQSQFGQIALTQDNISMQIRAIINNNISKLEMATYDNDIIISQISSQLNATNSYVSELTASTESSINQISTQLTTTNGTVISALNQLDTRSTTELKVAKSNITTVQTSINQISTQLTMTNGNISHITTELNTAKRNAISVQTQVDNLQTQVASIQTQLSQIHPCGPGEWRRVAYLNMRDPTQQCPSAWRLYNTGEVRACGRLSRSGGSCPATTYSIDIQYRRVCGRVVGYQYGSPDGFLTGNINQRYVDGVSITRGSPRDHVWTYAAGVTESVRVNLYSNCPCSGSPGRGAPSFVGNNYYCESGNPSSTWSNQLYTGDKLWDGLQCEGSCCTDTVTPLWFKVQLSNTTSDYIEIRICGDSGTSDEDTPVELIEIYGAP